MGPLPGWVKAQSALLAEVRSFDRQRLRPIGAIRVRTLVAEYMEPWKLEALQKDEAEQWASQKAVERLAALRRAAREDSLPCRVAPGLWLGSVGAARNLAALQEAGITHVINASPLVPCFFRNLELRDGPAFTTDSGSAQALSLAPLSLQRSAGRAIPEACSTKDPICLGDGSQLGRDPAQRFWGSCSSAHASDPLPRAPPTATPSPDTPELALAPRRELFGRAPTTAECPERGSAFLALSFSPSHSESLVPWHQSSGASDAPADERGETRQSVSSWDAPPLSATKDGPLCRTSSDRVLPSRGPEPRKRGSGSVYRLEYLSLPLFDDDSADLLCHVPGASAFMEAGCRAGGVLVHCFAGQSRSAALVMAHLIAGRGLRVEEALAAVRLARPVARPNLGFMRQLEALDREINGRGRGGAWEADWRRGERSAPLGKEAGPAVPEREGGEPGWLSSESSLARV